MTKLGMALIAVAVGGAAMMYFVEGPRPKKNVVGSAVAFDGDTLEFYASEGGGRYTIRLDALHAPELHESRGIAARDWMRKRLKASALPWKMKLWPHSNRSWILKT